jgi:hypothetical protein
MTIRRICLYPQSRARRRRHEPALEQVEDSHFPSYVRFRIPNTYSFEYLSRHLLLLWMRTAVLELKVLA